MHRHARWPIVGFVLLTLQLVTTSCSRESATSEESRPPAPKGSGLELSALNRSVDACTDFHQFACGQWLSNNPIPADRPRWGRFDELQERNLEVLRRILDAAAKGTDPSSRKIGDYYATCMDEATINARGRQPLDANLQQVAALGGVDQLPELLAAPHTIGVDAFFGFSAEGDFKDASTVIGFVDQGGMGLPDRDYYFRTDAKSAEIRRQYVEHVSKMMTLAGASPQEASAAASTVMRLETALAKAALDLVSRRDPARVYHKLPMAELQALTPEYDWSRYFQGVGAPQMAAVNVTEPDFIRAMGRVLASTPLDDLKTYLRWQLIHANAVILSAPFVDENFRFYSAVLSGVQEQRPRWKRCVGYVDSDMGEALGQAFVKETFGPEAKADMLKMVADVEGALERDIQALDWMTDATKAEARTKLHAIANKIGYPDKWRDYGALTIERGDALGNSQRSNAFEFRRQMNRIGKPLDKSEWDMTPPTVNAYYHPLQNNINFPAGILQPPFYGAGRDAAVNYGGAGAVIGHELTHGFDDQGRQFDAQGNLNDWWTPADAKAFEQRAGCIADQYSSYTAIDEVKVNGKLTLGENAADNGGVRIALMAYLASSAAKDATALEGFTPEQRFFVGYAQLWCENRRPEFERLQAQTNPHSPGRYRVNGVVSNMPEFQKAFSCPAGAAMARQPACRVW
jgi:putative endopeptidase